MKTCTRCEIAYTMSDFPVKPNTKDGFDTICKYCKRRANKVWYEANKVKQKTKSAARNKRWSAEITKWFRVIKSQGCCVCGEDCVDCLDFHHISDKDFEFSQARYFSLDRLRSELKKCVILCSNCHRKVHADVVCLVCPKTLTF